MGGRAKRCFVLVLAGPLGEQLSLDVARLVAKLDQEGDVVKEPLSICH